jgi:hypothetical protein
MNKKDDELMDVAIETSEGGMTTFTAHFADQEPIEGSLTVADLTATSCRWPSGDPRDLKTFRYCGDLAHDGPYCERQSRIAYV